MKLSRLSVCATLILSSAIADHVSISSNIMNFDYKEYSSTNGQILDSEGPSTLYGLTAKYAHNIFGSKTTTNEGLLFADIAFYGGNTTYAGSALGSGKPYGSATGTTANQIVNGKIGYIQYKNLKSINLYTQAAIGYRYWDRKLSSSQDEKYEWAYGNIKIGLDAHLSTKDNLGFNASYNAAISPTMKSSTSNQALNNTFNLGNTYGYAFCIPYTHHFTTKLSLLVSYTYQRWHIGASNSVNGYYEPRSTTTQSIGTVGLIYNY